MKHLFSSVAAYSLCLPGLVFSLSPPQISIQVDLIFPKNNTVYKAVHPFPIIYNLQNFNSTWTHMPSVSFEFVPIAGQNDTTDTTWHDMSVYQKIGYDATNPQIPQDYPSYPNYSPYPGWLPYPDQYIGATAFGNLPISKATVWRLQWEFFIARTMCTIDDEYCHWNSELSNYTYSSCGHITFQIDNATGTDPKIDTYPTTLLLGAIGVQQEPRVTTAIERKNCTVPTRPKPEKTYIEISSRAKTRIETPLMQLIRCPGTVWPNSSCHLHVATTSDAGRRSTFLGVNFTLASVLGLLFMLLQKYLN